MITLDYIFSSILLRLLSCELSARSHLRIISFISSGGHYWVARIKRNENCPVNGVITTESECVVAAAQLGLTYFNHATDNRRPAGCYTWLLEGTKATYFNKIVDTSSTFPESDTAGICRSGSTDYSFESDIF